MFHARVHIAYWAVTTTHEQILESYTIAFHAHVVACFIEPDVDQTSLERLFHSKVIYIMAQHGLLVDGTCCHEYQYINFQWHTLLFICD